MLRTSPFRTVAAAIAGLLLVAGLQTAAGAATSRAITMAVSASSGVVGSSVTFSGKVTHSPKGSTITIQRRSGKTTWISLRSTRTTNNAGHYKVAVTLPSTAGLGVYRAIAPATRRLRQAVARTLGVTALAKVTVTLHLNQNKVAAGSDISLSGTVKPFVANTLPNVQKLLRTGWTNIRTTDPVTSHGTFTGTVTITGDTQVRISVPRAGNNAPAYSPATVVTTTPVIATRDLPGATRLSAYSATLSTIDGSAGTWTATPLPAGLTLNATTGKISGTLAKGGSGPIPLHIGFIRTSSGDAAPTVTLALTVKQAAAAVTTPSLPSGTVGTAYTTTLDATSPAGAWTASPLPAGLSIDTATGVISGTPTDAGSTIVSVGFTQADTGNSAPAKTLTLLVKPVTTTASLPDGIAGTAYTTTLHNAGDVAGSWTASPLPAGLALNASTGAITGTPTDAGTTNVVIGFTQTGGGVAAAKTLALTVHPVISTSMLATGTVGATYSATLNGTGTGVWTADPLPAGLSLNASTGAIAGTPTDVGTTQVVIGYTSNGVMSDPVTLPLAIRPVINTASLPGGTVGTAYSLTLDGTGTGTWTASPLPAGLSIDANTGAITGTPTAGGATSVLIGYTSNGVAASSKTLIVTIKPVITTTALPDGDTVASYSFTLDGSGTGTWTATPLPAGLSLNAGTGAITGSPTTPGTTSVLIGYTSGGVAATTKTLSLVVHPVITTTSLPDGTRVSSYTTTLTADGNPSGTWSAAPLPAGLSLNTSTGAITGTPTAVGDTSVVIGFTSGGVLAATTTLTLHVNEAAPPTISTTTLPNGKQLVAYSADLNATGNPAGTWTATGLPTGLSLDTTTGAITGTPTSSADVGDHLVHVTFTQTSTTLSDAADLTLHIDQADPPVISTSALDHAQLNQPYSFTVHATGDPVGTWTATGLPTGLAIDPDTGIISGTPTDGGQVTDNSVTIHFTQTNTSVAATPVILDLVVDP